MMILFDFECSFCGHEFEELAERDSPDQVKCPLCASSKTKRLISAPNIDPRLGVQSGVFTTMADKWEKKQRQRMAIEAKRRASHGED